MKLRTITRNRSDVDLTWWIRFQCVSSHLYHLTDISCHDFQVLRQADTIRDLTTTSEKLSSLEEAERSLRDRAESAEAELVCIHLI